MKIILEHFSMFGWSTIISRFRIGNAAFMNLYFKSNTVSYLFISVFRQCSGVGRILHTGPHHTGWGGQGWHSTDTTPSKWYITGSEWLNVTEVYIIIRQTYMTTEYNVITSVSTHLWSLQWRLVTTCWYDNKCHTRSPETWHVLFQPICNGYRKWHISCKSEQLTVDSVWLNESVSFCGWIS